MSITREEGRELSFFAEDVEKQEGGGGKGGLISMFKKNGNVWI